MRYVFRKSARAKHLRITIQRNGEVTITLPRKVSETDAAILLQEKKEWIEKGVRKMKENADITNKSSFPQLNSDELKKVKNEAKAFILERLKHFNSVYQTSWNRVVVKNVSSRWGSCSKKGNLNFNYRIMFLREELRDYIIVHELCHLKELNHSQVFWSLVEKAVPDYLILRKELKGIF